MTIERKLTKTTSAGASDAVYVEDVFSTWLYSGTGASQTITNGIDLSTKGGLVWIKARTASTSVNHNLYDTARGANKFIMSNTTSANSSGWTDMLTGFGTSGFTLGADSAGYINTSAQTYASWTFRKQPKFFDCITWTGNGSNSQTVAHALGSQPGFIIIKSTSDAGTNWHTLARVDATNYANLTLNSTSQAASTTITQSNVASSSALNVGWFTQTWSNVNSNGSTYVAYLFAHDAGGFGAAGTDSVVSCGSFTTSSNGSADVTLGWEAQFVLVKSTSLTQGWFLLDNMRGNQRYLMPSNSSAESDQGADAIVPTATGFRAGAGFLANSSNYIYLAIRRGPMKTPTDATKVFNVSTASMEASSTALITGGSFAPDMVLHRPRVTNASYTHYVVDRLRGNYNQLSTSTTGAEGSLSSPEFWKFDRSDAAYIPASGFFNNNGEGSIAYTLRAFRRAPGFFDVVCYTGTGAVGSVSHNLGVAPELFIVKRRDAVGNWAVYSKFTTTSYSYQVLQLDNAGTNNKLYGVGGSPNFEELSSAPSATTINLASSVESNGSGRAYVAYLFATCPGVSKVGSYTGNGSSQTINCGFTNGARFVLIKRTDSTGDWYVWDTARGIVSGNDPRLSLNTTAAEVTTDDTIDPASSGFIVNQVAATNVNVSSGSYIYLAIA